MPVFDAVVSIHVDSTGEVVRVTSSAGRTDGRRRGATVTVAQAAVAAARNIRPELPFEPTPVADASGVARFARGQFRRDLLASLTWLPVDGVLRLAWHVTVEPESESELYDVLIDATTGEVLLRRNRVHFAEGSGRIMQSNAMNAFDPRRLDPMPMGQPGTSCPPPSNYQLRSLNTPFRDPSTTLFDTGRLSGNNAHVFRRDPSTEGALGTRNGASWKFDFPFNSDDSAETALFFALNFAHDFFYDLGFDEAAGNFQVDNFNRGGSGGDPIRGNARAVGRNNANYVHAADGSSPQINMFLWDGAECWSEDVDFDGGPDLDGDYDFDIILHEYHHGVSLRLSAAFTGVEAGAMGEGGGDFFAYSVNGNTLLAEYARPGGLRGVNSKTYADWWCRFGLVCEVHDNGEIWANVLWDTRERFRIDGVGGTEASGVNEVHQLYIDSLKLAPPAPTMLDMRDTMLLDDALRNPAGARSANFCRLWEAFAGRGMGAAAVDTASHGFNSVVADFTVPEGCVAPPSLPVVTVTVAVPTAAEAGPVSGAFRLSRSVASADPVTIQYSISGTALNGTDYQIRTGVGDDSCRSRRCPGVDRAHRRYGDRSERERVARAQKRRAVHHRHAVDRYDHDRERRCRGGPVGLERECADAGRGWPHHPDNRHDGQSGNRCSPVVLDVVLSVEQLSARRVGSDRGDERRSGADAGSVKHGNHIGHAAGSADARVVHVVRES